MADHNHHQNHNNHNHTAQAEQDQSEHEHSKAHEGHDHSGHTDHSGHEFMFRNRFWVSLVLTIPVLIFSPMIQEWFGFTAPEFTGSNLVGPIFAIIIFLYGGIPFFQMAVPEIKQRTPGMMTLISLAVGVAFLYLDFIHFRRRSIKCQ